MKSEEMLQNPYGYTFIDIISYLNAKVTIPLQRMYGLANRCASHADLEYICETKDCPEFEAGVQDCLFLLQRPLSTFVNIMIFFLENMCSTIKNSASLYIYEHHTRARVSAQVWGIEREYPKLLSIYIYIYIFTQFA